MAKGKWKAGTTGTIVTQMGFAPIRLKQLVLDCDIAQGEIAEAAGTSRATINSCINKGYIPTTIPDFRQKVERFLVDRKREAVERWLITQGMRLADIWAPLGKEMRKKHPSGMVRRTLEGRGLQKPLNTDDPTTIEGGEAMYHETLHPEAMKKFRLFRHPFLNDVTCEKDIYMSDEHRYIETAMMDAAMHAGFMAVVGEVQGGKSTIRKKVVEGLMRDGKVSVIFPRSTKVNMKDRRESRINATNLCDAIIRDISGETPKNKTEDKVRQLEQLLITRTKQGFVHVLIIEEAQNLTTVAFKYLKQFYEFEDGFKKLLAIIVLGQPELMEFLDERTHPELREVSRRMQVAQIQGLNGNLGDYLAFKFKRVGAKLEDIFDEGAVESLSRRLTVDDGRGRKISHAYPGLVNLYAVRAINLAYEMGESKVTVEVVEAI